MLVTDAAISEWISLDEIEPRLVAAVVLAEDRDFWRHRGIDWSAGWAAATKNLEQRLIRAGASAILRLSETPPSREGRVLASVRGSAEEILEERTIKWGASTIPMQLARMLRGWSKRTYLRKLREALMALWLVARYDRDTILEAYLNLTSFVRGTRGVAASSAKLLGCAPMPLSEFDATLLAAAISVHPEASPESLARFADWLQHTQVRLVVQLSEARQLPASDAAIAFAEIASRWKGVSAVRRPRSRARHRALAWALAQVGTTDAPACSEPEGGVEAWQREFGLGDGSWCGCFVGYGLRVVAGIREIDQRVVWVPFVAEDARARRRGWKQFVAARDARPGDVAIFCWDGSGEPQHTGFVLVNDQAGQTMHTVEGNTTEGADGDQSNGHGVFLRRRAYDSILGCASPRYPGPDAEVRAIPLSCGPPRGRGMPRPAG